MANQPIPIAKADLMIATYISYMTSLGADMKKQTQSVSFAGTELLSWLNKVMPYADELRIFMGDYAASDPFAGRTTVLLWPYKDGKPAVLLGSNDDYLTEGEGEFKPYNVGTLNP